MAQHRDVTLGREVFAFRLDKAGSHITNFNVSEKSIQIAFCPCCEFFEMKIICIWGCGGLPNLYTMDGSIYTVKKKNKMKDWKSGVWHLVKKRGKEVAGITYQRNLTSEVCHLDPAVPADLGSCWSVFGRYMIRPFCP